MKRLRRRKDDDRIYSSMVSFSPDGTTHRQTWREQAAVEAERAQRAETFARILSDLDRCEHGRHEGDICGGAGGCNGPSLGNPYSDHDWPHTAASRLKRRFPDGLPARTIGFNISGKPIVVPDRQRMGDSGAWEPEAR